MPSSISIAVRSIRVTAAIFVLDLFVSLTAIAGRQQQQQQQQPPLSCQCCTGSFIFRWQRRAATRCSSRWKILVPMFSPPKYLTMDDDVDMIAAKNCDNSVCDYTEITDDFGSKGLVSQINGEDGNIFQFIRLEKEFDAAVLKDIATKDDIARRIMEVREGQSIYGRADLYSREWEHSPELLAGENLSRPIASFTAMQFNALAEGLSSCLTKRPFKDHKGLDPRDSAAYGGFTSIPHPSISLDFNRRKWRLLEVAFGHDMDTPYDIIAMEEIDRYRGFFGPMFRLLGYESLFVPKKNSPGVCLGWYSDGCMLAWKSSMFDLLRFRTGDYTVGNQVFVVAMLQHKYSKQKIVVAVTHLKAQQSEVNEVIRSRQVEELLIVIDNEVKQLTDISFNEQVPIIVLGDFNADPPSQIDFECSAIQKILNHRIETINSPQEFCYKSAYNIDDRSGDLFTSWKIRGTKVSKRIIDYIFFAGSSIQCTATLKVASRNHIEATKLPGLRHPSDHLHIAAKFEIR
jgi:endonuclease/exonuclease/phosphatase family metal-dependent hydrolase